MSIRSQSQTSMVKVTEVKTNFAPIWVFSWITPIWIHKWLRNYAQSLKWRRRGTLLFFMSSVMFQGHAGQKSTHHHHPIPHNLTPHPHPHPHPQPHPHPTHTGMFFVSFLFWTKGRQMNECDSYNICSSWVSIYLETAGEYRVVLERPYCWWYIYRLLHRIYTGEIHVFIMEGKIWGVCSELTSWSLLYIFNCSAVCSILL